VSWLGIAAIGAGVIGLALVLAVGVVIWLRRKQFPTMMTSDGRRAWAFLAIVGGCVVFTLFAAIGVWLVSGHALYSLVLALAAHVQILVGLTAMGVLLGRRMQVSAGREGVTLSDAAEDTVLGAKIATGAAQGATDAMEHAAQGKGEGGLS
jgi:hypothetical protein